ncbi:hypothetical protein BKA70DRAFT_561594 [Coprinopsis sp. MPI-PUGE-AT-0042]|nr:hypothetical protein BKA70DRAFT_561594 [Coprinopsis sp. MPI-PUGE-AT-0042]
MPSILKSLLGGSAKSAKSQSSGNKLKKGSSIRSQRPIPLQPIHDRHPDDRGSGYSDDVYGKEKHPEFVGHPLRPIPKERTQEHGLVAPSGLYPNITYADTRYPINMPRYELYDPGGPGPLPVASLHRAPSHEFYEPHAHHGLPNAPSVHHFPSNFQPLPVPPPRPHPDASWEPMPDVHRESTIVDPEAYQHHSEMRGYDSEEERWMRAQEDPPLSEGYGRFVAPGRTHSDHRSVRREDIVPHFGGQGDWERTENPFHGQTHPRRGPMLQVAPSQSPIHREDIDKGHHPRHLTPAPSLHPAASIAEQRSNRLSTGSGSKFQEHLVSPEVNDRRSLKKKLSNIFNKGPEGHSVPLAPSGGLTHSHSRASGVVVNPPAGHNQVAREASRQSQVTVDSFEEDWREDGDVYQYIVPPGVNVIFKDKHGNEITRCEPDCFAGSAVTNSSIHRVGDYPDSARSKRRSRRSAPIVVIDQNGTVLYE